MINKVVVITAVTFFVCSCRHSESFTLQFPENADLGELWLMEDVNCFTCGNGQEYLGRATGAHDVSLPAPHWYVSLRMPEQAAHLMPHLSHPLLANVGEIILTGSDIQDDDLAYVSSISLRSIGLGGTGITGEGLRHVSKNADWIFIDLRGCKNLEPHYLSHFKGWTRSTIRVASADWSSGTYSKADSTLLEEASRYICEGQTEEICHTQIR